MMDEILGLMLRQGARQYDDEPISQLAHALQCAAWAERAGAPPPLVVAALLHDYGHLVAADEAAARHGIDAQHERIGAAALARWFGDDVVAPIRLHVDAKRYLCVAEAGYAAALSPASVRSLALQGGPFTAAGAAEFLARPFAPDAVALRRWDELAKDPDAETPGLDHYRPLLAACASPHPSR